MIRACPWVGEMKSVGHEELFVRFQGKPPANPGSIARCEADLGVTLPTDYVRLLQQMNGGVGFIGENYLALWSIEYFTRMNTNTYFGEAAPGRLTASEVRFSIVPPGLTFFSSHGPRTEVLG